MTASGSSAPQSGYALRCAKCGNPLIRIEQSAVEMERMIEEDAAIAKDILAEARVLREALKQSRAWVAMYLQRMNERPAAQVMIDLIDKALGTAKGGES